MEEEVKKCNTCGKILPLNCFYQRKPRYTRSECKKCYNKRNAEHRKQNSGLEHGFRRCERCGKILPLDDFEKCGKGFRNICRTCTNIRQNEWAKKIQVEKQTNNRTCKCCGRSLTLDNFPQKKQRTWICFACLDLQKHKKADKSEFEGNETINEIGQIIENAKVNFEEYLRTSTMELRYTPELINGDGSKEQMRAFYDWCIERLKKEKERFL